MYFCPPFYIYKNNGGRQVLTVDPAGPDTNCGWPVYQGQQKESGGHVLSQFLSDQLTLFKPGGQIRLTTLLLPPPTVVEATTQTYFD